jgi:hypothetical protein
VVNILSIANRLVRDESARDEVRRRIANFCNGGYSEISEGLPSFCPNSAITKRADLATLRFKAAQNAFPLLVTLLERNGRKVIAPISPEEFCNDGTSQENANQLGRLFQSYGSDKASHKYHYIYGKILGRVNTLFEIGLGTNNAEVVSNMGPSGSPGASLRSFRDFLPQALIYGADIDREILFKEDRIETYYLDQTDFESYKALPRRRYDIIIDDGLHTVDANFTVLCFAVEVINPEGWIVIEDIYPQAEMIWQVVPYLLPSDYDSYLIKTAHSLVFATKKSTSN